MTISRGFYVHYKGGIYFVQATAYDGDSQDTDKALVVYESVQGCGDSFVFDPKTGRETRVPMETPTDLGPRTRTVEQFSERVNSQTGEYDPNGIPRFQRVVGWAKSGETAVTPLVMVGGRVQAFHSQYKES